MCPDCDTPPLDTAYVMDNNHNYGAIKEIASMSTALGLIPTDCPEQVLSYLNKYYPI